MVIITKFTVFLLYRHKSNLMGEHSYCTSMTKLMPGQSIKLLQNSHVIGTGKVVDGNVLHGHAIPESFVKVAIMQIEANIAPLFKTTFDQPYLSAGEFTAWPTSQCVVF